MGGSPSRQNPRGGSGSGGCSIWQGAGGASSTSGQLLPCTGMRSLRRPGYADLPLPLVPKGGRGKAALARPRLVDAAAQPRPAGCDKREDSEGYGIVWSGVAELSGGGRCIFFPIYSGKGGELSGKS